MIRPIFGGHTLLLRTNRRQIFNSCRLIHAVGLVTLLATTAHGQLTSLRLENFATVPITGSTVSPAVPSSNTEYLARINFMAENPSNSDQFFVNDLNGPLYILDRQTKQFSQYLNFNGTGSAAGLYDRLYFNQGGFAAGLITFQFDPDYANNGKFYTVHMESGSSGSQIPTHPNLDTSSYGVTSSIDAPGSVSRVTVLVEWTDSNINNNTFEGSARELLRMDMRDRIHPMGDVIFNPTAGPGDPDWRMMYISVGDAGNGEQSDSATRRTPQLLNALGGKILRIAPDENVNLATTLSPNGKYRIPVDNPFAGVADVGGTNGSVRDEIWALGLRNPHRMSWDVDPTTPESNQLIVSDIGLHSWEEVNIIHKGANYGYSQREGNQVLVNNGQLGPIPNPDTIPNQLICSGSGFSSCTSNGTVTPTYPVVQYGHGLAGQDQLIAGDAVSSGYVYRGSKIPQLYGKFLFGDISTGAIYYADYAEMLAADDGDPTTLAEIHSLDILWDDPNDTPDDGEQLYGTLTSSNAIRGPLHQIVEAGYEARGGQDPDLPGGAATTGTFGRADIRIQVDNDGELYILSKSDGMIRAITGPEPLPGDYNYDGTVDAVDYGVWKDSFGSSVPRLGLWADGNQDGVVDAADYTVWRDNFSGVEGGGSLAVPEPSTALLAVACGVLAAATRWRNQSSRRGSTG
jgi:Glucose / Sorbosone dehydrogenase